MESLPCTRPFYWQGGRYTDVQNKSLLSGTCIPSFCHIYGILTIEWSNIVLHKVLLIRVHLLVHFAHIYGTLSVLSTVLGRRDIDVDISDLSSVLKQHEF